LNTPKFVVSSKGFFGLYLNRETHKNEPCQGFQEVEPISSGSSALRWKTSSTPFTCPLTIKGRPEVTDKILARQMGFQQNVIRFIFQMRDLDELHLQCGPAGNALAHPVLAHFGWLWRGSRVQRRIPAFVSQDLISKYRPHQRRVLS